MKNSDQNKNLLKAIKNTEKQSNPTTQGALAALQKLMNSVDKSWVSQKLTASEKAGLIEKTMGTEAMSLLSDGKQNTKIMLHFEE